MTKKEIKEQLAVLYDQIGKLEELLDQSRRAEHNLSSSTLVKVEGRTYRFSHLYGEDYGGTPWIKGFLQKKDGTFSKKSVPLYSQWVVVQNPDKDDAR